MERSERSPAAAVAPRPQQRQQQQPPPPRPPSRRPPPPPPPPPLPSTVPYLSELRVWFAAHHARRLRRVVALEVSMSWNEHLSADPQLYVTVERDNVSGPGVLLTVVAQDPRDTVYLWSRFMIMLHRKRFKLRQAQGRRLDEGRVWRRRRWVVRMLVPADQYARDSVSREFNDCQVARRVFARPDGRLVKLEGPAGRVMWRVMKVLGACHYPPPRTETENLLPSMDDYGDNGRAVVQSPGPVSWTRRRAILVSDEDDEESDVETDEFSDEESDDYGMNDADDEESYEENNADRKYVDDDKENDADDEDSEENNENFDVL